ncbi:transposase [Thermogemmata fonticola]|uniref:Transposase n=1 Tax=Thermogemmata fonticola TaxID=2755323 RepID=A0A7V8VAZ2_9BACT|nr:transposase [Thermogemmata fonticola]
MPPYDPQRHHRRSIRLKGYDYTQPGAYFVTLCTHERAHLFGRVVDGKMVLNDFGEIVREEWFRSADIRAEIELHPDEFVVMPNHVHGIVWIVDNAVATGPNVGATGRSPLHEYPPRGPAKRSLSSFIAGFKSAVTTRINQMRGTPGTPVWQRNYYEHIIRDNVGVTSRSPLQAIRRYIRDNPLRWYLDRYNPDAAGSDPLAREIWRMLNDQEDAP